MNLTFDALRPDYEQRYSTLKITHPRDALTAARRLLVYKERFLAVQTQCGVPALWLMPVWFREDDEHLDRFTGYFGNGDPLDRPTTHVPMDRGPFASWEDGVADALRLDHVTAVDVWSWPVACYEWEKWNGFGVRRHGRTSGYVYAGTSAYYGGMYHEDGVWSPGSWDHRPGCIAIAESIITLDSSFESSFR